MRSSLSIALALAGVGLWSLVIGHIVAESVAAVLYLASPPARIRPRWNAGAARWLWRTGRGFTLQGTFTFLEQNVDYLIIGGTLGAQPLGLYGLGYRMSELPYKAIVDPVAEVAFPGFARLQARGEDPTRPFLAYLRFVVLVAFPMGVILAGVTVPFIQTILGPRWEALQGVLPILAVWGSVRTLQGAIGWFLNSVGHTERLAVSYGCMLVFTIPLLLVNAHLFGLPGVAASMLLSMMIMLMIGVHITSQRVGIGWRVQWHAIRPSVLASIPAGGSAAAASAMFHRLPAGVVLAIGVAVGVAVYGAAVRLLAPGLIGEARRQLSRILRTMPV